MKKMFLMCLIAGSLFALEPPEPITGESSWTSSKELSIAIGDANLKFNLPGGWGIGETSMSAGKSGYFTLYPTKGGYGCAIGIEPMKSVADLEARMALQKESFLQTMDLEDGFEAQIGPARYSCRKNDLFLIETWYVLLGESSEADSVWQALKSCISVAPQRVVQPFFDDTESMHEWKFNHPARTHQVLLKKSIMETCQVNPNPDGQYLVGMDSYSHTAYFYLKWNQENLDTLAPFKDQLDEMQEEILALMPSQRFEKNYRYDQEEGWAILKGRPYSLISLSGEGFLFGFAIRSKSVFNVDLTDFIKRVSWRTAQK